jgi:uncharacterized protein
MALRQAQTAFDRGGSRTYDTRPMSRPPAEPNAQPAPFVVDAMVMAHSGLTWEREFNDRRFQRLVGVALSATPSVAIKLKFAMLDRRPVIHGEIRALIELVCQRCMGNMQYPVVESIDLMLVETEAELALVPESHEPWMATVARLDMLELVEEQLLLALPLIAKHLDEAECVTAVGSATSSGKRTAPLALSDGGAAVSNPEVQRPFGNLRDLLGK